MNIHIPHQIIKDAEGKDSHVIITINDFNDLTNSLKSDEELLDEAITADEETFPHDFVMKLADAENTGKTLQLWRKYRNFTQKDLAAAIGLKSRQYIYELETSRRKGPLETWRNLATALKIDLDDLL